ncbi:hypothetical protein DFH06DRAFT_1430639 [Mycena polygramma]|nr:hypothetical protein DFH06DRAFT_1430639 [Mycena polygramma]
MDNSWTNNSFSPSPDPDLFTTESPGFPASSSNLFRGRRSVAGPSFSPQPALSPLSPFFSTAGLPQQGPDSPHSRSVSSTSSRTLDTSPSLDRHDSTKNYSSWSPGIGEATHDMLIAHGNVDHANLYKQFQMKSQRLETLTVAYSELKIRYETLQSNFSELTTAVASKLDASTIGEATVKMLRTHEPLSKKDFPEVPIWTDKEYLEECSERKKAKGPVTMQDAKSSRGSKRLAEDDENVQLWFVTDKHGETVPGSWGTEARKKARGIWATAQLERAMPPTWSEADSVLREFFAYEMELTFPELRLCEYSCKAHRIATLVYPGWYSSQIKKNTLHTTAKPDPNDTDDDAARILSEHKRQASQPVAEEPDPKRNKKVSKKHKAAANAPAPAAASRIEDPSTAVDPVTSVANGVPTPSDSVPAPVLSPPAPLVSPSTPASSTPSFVLDTASVRTDVASTSSLAIPPNTVFPPATASTAKESLDAPATEAPPAHALPSTTPVPAPATQVDNPLAALGNPMGPTARGDYVSNLLADPKGKRPSTKVNYLRPTSSSITARNLCLADYVNKRGRVTKEVFDLYYNGLSAESKQVFITKSAELGAAKKAEKTTQNNTPQDGEQAVASGGGQQGRAGGSGQQAGAGSRREWAAGGSGQQAGAGSRRERARAAGGRGQQARGLTPEAQHNKRAWRVYPAASSLLLFSSFIHPPTHAPSPCKKMHAHPVLLAALAALSASAQSSSRSAASASASTKNYTSTFLTCLTACPSEVASAEALVEQFCAAAATPTSLSFASFNPSATPSSLSTSSSSKSGSASGSSSGSGTGSSASQTAPPTSSSSGAGTSNAAAAVRGVGLGVFGVVGAEDRGGVEMRSVWGYRGLGRLGILGVGIPGDGRGIGVFVESDLRYFWTSTLGNRLACLLCVNRLLHSNAFLAPSPFCYVHDSTLDSGRTTLDTSLSASPPSPLASPSRPHRIWILRISPPVFLSLP